MQMERILAFNVKRILREKGWKARDLAGRYPSKEEEGIGVTDGYISQITGGLVYPARGTIENLKIALETTEEELIRPPIWADDELTSYKLAKIPQELLQTLQKILDILIFSALLNDTVWEIFLNNIESVYKDLILKLQEPPLSPELRYLNHLAKSILNRAKEN
jgi:transcriptional regulator with XRE-family HTH domain